MAKITDEQKALTEQVDELEDKELTYTNRVSNIQTRAHGILGRHIFGVEELADRHISLVSLFGELMETVGYLLVTNVEIREKQIKIIEGLLEDEDG